MHGALKAMAVVGFESSPRLDRGISDDFRWGADSRLGDQLDLGSDYSHAGDLAVAAGAVDSTRSGANAIGDGGSHRRTGSPYRGYYTVF